MFVAAKTRCPEVQAITGNLVIARFLPPKLLWVKQHEPDILTQNCIKVTAAKRLSAFSNDGRVRRRCIWNAFGHAFGSTWNSALEQYYAASNGAKWTADCRRWYEASGNPGHDQRRLGETLVLPIVPVVAGVAIMPQAPSEWALLNRKETIVCRFGTSGVIFFGSAIAFTANPAVWRCTLVHAIPNTWHTMSVMLSALVRIDWSWLDDANLAM